jgi:hypothetical protein
MAEAKDVRGYARETANTTEGPSVVEKETKKATAARSAERRK